jgi:1-acyl-sn-glycerol-3-phosphate acyltransferase
VEHPQCNFIAHCVGRFILWVTGWQVEGSVPQTGKMVIIAAPHTSNWDLLYLLGAAYSLRLSIFWLAKDSLFLPILRQVMRFFGGIPVDRSKRNNLVMQLVTRFTQQDQLAIVIPPSGTRKRTKFWHSGFYQIAKGARIHMVCGFLDYERKVAGLGPAFVPGNDVCADMDRIREFYKPIQARYPEKTSRIVLKQESSTEE